MAAGTNLKKLMIDKLVDRLKREGERLKPRYIVLEAEQSSTRTYPTDVKLYAAGTPVESV